MIALYWFTRALYELTWPRSTVSVALYRSTSDRYCAYWSDGIPFGYFASIALICWAIDASAASLALTADFVVASWSFSVVSWPRRTFLESTHTLRGGAGIAVKPIVLSSRSLKRFGQLSTPTAKTMQLTGWFMRPKRSMPWSTGSAMA